MAKHPGGRPTTYKPEYVDKVYEYINSCQDEFKEWKVKYTSGIEGTNETIENIHFANIPTIEGFARYINTSITTMDGWRDNNPEFSGALEDLKYEQKQKLIQGGLTGTYNSTIAKLILSSNHDMKERVDATSGDKPVQQNVDLSQLDTDTLEKLLKARKK
jgi:hypothetical protein